MRFILGFSGFLDEDGLVHDISYQNIIEPFYINIAINMNNSYAPAYKKEPFKYQVVVLVSKLILNTSPDMVRDMMQLSQYTEMYSYYKDLKKYRPTMRIQAFIEYRESQGGKLTAS